MPYGLSAKEILGLSVVGAAVTTLGTLIGLVLKERFFVRSFERWRSRQSLESVRQKYRDPIVLGALELCSRLNEICHEYPTEFLRSSLDGSIPGAVLRKSSRDSYYYHYKLESSLYRLCAFLGWLELYRQDQVFLDAGEHPGSKDVEEAIRNIRADLADGHLNTAQDWEHWTDALIFREEQRAIGELLIVSSGGLRTVMGYGGFVELLTAPKDGPALWLGVARNFLLDLAPQQDFRRVRLERLLVHLVDLVEAMEPRRLQQRHRDARERVLGVVAPVSDAEKPQLL